MLGTGPTPFPSKTITESGTHQLHNSMARPEHLGLQPGVSPPYVVPTRLPRELELRLDSSEVSRPLRQDVPNPQQSDPSIANSSMSLSETSQARQPMKNLPDAPGQVSPAVPVADRSLSVAQMRSPMISETKVAPKKVSELPVKVPFKSQSAGVATIVGSPKSSETFEVIAGPGGISDTVVKVPVNSQTELNAMTTASVNLFEITETNEILKDQLEAQVVLPVDSSLAMARSELPEESEVALRPGDALEPEVGDGDKSLAAEVSVTSSIVRFSKVSETEISSDVSMPLSHETSILQATTSLISSPVAKLKVGSESQEREKALGNAVAQEVARLQPVDDSVTMSPVSPSEELEVELGFEDPMDIAEEDTVIPEPTDTPLYAAMVQVSGAAEAQTGTNEILEAPLQEVLGSAQRDNPLTIESQKLTDESIQLPSVPQLPYRIQAGPGPMQIAVRETGDSRPAMTAVAAVPDPPRGPKSSPAEFSSNVTERQNQLPGLDVRISVDLRQMDILAVMKFLAKEGNLNIVAGKNVGGRISLTLKEVTVLDILDIIALSYELAYVVQNGIIHMMTEADYTRLFGAPFADQRKVRTIQLENADANAVAALLNNMKSAVGRVIGDPQTRTLVLIDVPEKLGPMVTAAENMDEATKLQTQVFELHYGKAEEVQPEIEKVLTPNLGGVRLDKRTNTLVVTDLASRMNDVQRVLRAFDRKTREVNIESKIIQVRLSDKYQMGVNWEVLFKQLADLRLQGTFPIAPPVGAAGPIGRLTVGTLADDDFTAVLDLLQTVGKTNVLSTPQIAVVENEEAKILVGTREAFITSSVTSTTSATTTAEEVTFVDVGVSLTVTPTINREGYVTMKIKPEVSSVNRTLTTASGNQIPIVQTSTAESTVMVKDGVTIIIAGLIEDQSIQTTNKVPLLGDIPFLGAAFRNKDDEIIKSELVIFLTPTIISGRDSIASGAPTFP